MQHKGFEPVESDTGEVREAAPAAVPQILDGVRLEAAKSVVSVPDWRVAFGHVRREDREDLSE
ncbi:hypothetical protein KNE206_30410 [Kitasatospora sp. NE20-6]